MQPPQQNWTLNLDFKHGFNCGSNMVLIRMILIDDSPGVLKMKHPTFLLACVLKENTYICWCVFHLKISICCFMSRWVLAWFIRVVYICSHSVRFWFLISISELYYRLYPKTE